MRLEYRVYAGLNNSAFHVQAVLSRCAALIRLKAVLQTVIAFGPACSYNAIRDSQATLQGGSRT